jgi:hypothetical protein
MNSNTVPTAQDFEDDGFIEFLDALDARLAITTPPMMPTLPDEAILASEPHPDTFNYSGLNDHSDYRYW